MPNFKSDIFGVIPHDVSSPIGASTPSGITIFTLAMDDTKVKNVQDEYTLDETGAGDITAIAGDPKTVVMDTSVKVSENDLAGSWVWVTGHAKNYLIAANTSAVAGSRVTITLEDDIDTALVDTDVVKVRSFRGYNYASRHGSFQSYLETYHEKNTDGDYEVATSEVGYYSLRSYSRNGGQVFYVMPVEYSATKATLLSNLDVTGDVTAQAELLKIADASFMCTPKGYTTSTAVTATEHQSVDGAYVDYCIARATDTTGDKRRMHYLYGVNSNTITAATTYMTDLNKNSERTSGIFPDMKVRPASGIELKRIDSSPAYCGLIGKVHSISENREGQAPAGVQDSQMADIVKNAVEIGKPDLINLQAAQLNAIVDFNGFYVHGEFTNKTTVGKIERNAHIVYASNRISNSSIAFAETFTQRPNTVTERNKITRGLSDICKSAKAQGVIQNFSIKDKTTVLNEQSNLGVWGIFILHNSVLEFLDLTFSSSLGEL